MRIEKREDELKAQFIAQFWKMFTKRQYFILQHQDMRKSGYPDIEIVGNKLDTHWEFKHGTPDFSSPGIQEITCRRIAKHAYCRYVIFFELYDRSEIWIAHPDHVHRRNGKTNAIGCEHVIVGFDFRALCDHVHSIHYPA